MPFSFDDFFAVFIRSLLFFLMNDLFRIHSFYMYSLNSFVVIFMRGIDLVSEDKAAGKGKGSLMSRFKKAARKIIQSQRFSWNVDILHTVTAITKGGQGMNMMDIQGTTTTTTTTTIHPHMRHLLPPSLFFDPLFFDPIVFDTFKPKRKQAKKIPWPMNRSKLDAQRWTTPSPEACLII